MPIHAQPRDSAGFYLEGLDRLRAARAVIDAVLCGEWTATAEVLGGIDRLVREAHRRFQRAEGLALHERRLEP